MADFKIKEGIYYTKDHEWFCPLAGGNLFSVGISDYAQDALGDIVYVDISIPLDEKLAAKDNIGIIESVKAVGDIYAPASGKLIEINESLKEEPGQINANAYNAWLIKMVSNDIPTELGLMDAVAYRQYLSKL